MERTGSVWQVHGTPTGLVDALPMTSSENRVYRYAGHVWGRVYPGRYGLADETNRVTGQLQATYGPRDHYGPGADDALTLILSHMYREWPNGTRSFLPGMIYHGEVGTNRSDPGYDPRLDTATFTLLPTLPPTQFGTTPGREYGVALGSFYGPNGEAVAGTFWYLRDGHRIEGVFGGELE